MQLNALLCINISKRHFISLKRIRIRFKIKEGQNKLQIHRRIILHVVKETNFHESGIYFVVLGLQLFTKEPLTWMFV